MKHAGPTRREIGVRTAFNLLGPLTNPAGTTRQLLGVGDATAAARIAEVAQRLGTERTFVIHGAGIDELPLDDSGVLYHVGPDGIERHDIAASKLGLHVTPTSRLAGGSPDDNARTIEVDLPWRARVRSETSCCSMPGAAFLVAGEVEQLEGGIERAALTIDAGLATDLLQRSAPSAPRTCPRSRDMSRRDATERRRRDRCASARRPRGRARAARPSPGDRPSAAADRRASGCAGPAPHRGAQAILAVGRADRRRRRGPGRPGAGIRGRRGRRDLGAVRAPLVRRLDRRPAPGPRRGVGIPVLAKEFVVDARQLPHPPRRRGRRGPAAGRPASGGAPGRSGPSRVRRSGSSPSSRRTPRLSSTPRCRPMPG